MEGAKDWHSIKEKAAKRMSRILTKSHKKAFKAHERVMTSGSQFAKYNSHILRQLEKDFAANPDLDLLSAITPTYSASAETMRAQKVTDLSAQTDTSDELGPSSKRLRSMTDETIPTPKHLQVFASSGEVTIKAQLAPIVSEYFPRECSQKDVLAVLRRSELVYMDDMASVRMILKMSDKIIVKIVPDPTGTTSPEYSALEFLEEHCIDVSAPKPLGMLTLNGRLLIFMSHIPGKSLDKVWSSLTEEQKTSVSTQLDGQLSNLRSYKLPPGQVWGGLGGEGCVDVRRNVRRSTEQIMDPTRFEDFFFSNPKYGSDVYVKFLRQLYNTAAEHQPECCVLTHSDLRQANIMVQMGQDQDITISGIVDWEYSGVYPTYWESIKLTNCMDSHDSSDWFLYLPEAISPFKQPVKWLLDRAWDNHVT